MKASLNGLTPKCLVTGFQQMGGTRRTETPLMTCQERIKLLEKEREALFYLPIIKYQGNYVLGNSKAVQ